MLKNENLSRIFPVRSYRNITLWVINACRLRLRDVESLQILLNYLGKCPKLKKLNLQIWNPTYFNTIWKIILNSKFPSLEKGKFFYWINLPCNLNRPCEPKLPIGEVTKIKNSMHEIVEKMPKIKTLHLGTNHLLLWWQISMKT